MHPPPLGLEREYVLWGQSMHVLQDGELHRDLGLGEEVAERRQEEVWGNPKVESGQRDWQVACCMMHDEQCLLHSDLWKQQSVQPTGCAKECRRNMCCSGAACHLLQLWARDRESRGFSGERDLIHRIIES